MNTLTQIIDYVIIISFLIVIYNVFKGTKIFKIFSFFVGLFILKKISLEFNLIHTSKVLSFLLDNALILLFIVFQDEIRQFIFKISKLLTNLKTPNNKDFSVSSTDLIVRACQKLSEKHIGALIVFEKTVSLDDFASKGILLNSDISKEIILSIFDKRSPLHDGAIIINKEKIISASNFFPIKTDDNIENKFGTRHRSALGISEETDAIVIVVSEETGEMRIAENGQFSKPLKQGELKIMLEQKLSSVSESDSVKLSNVAYRISSWIKRVVSKNNQ